MALFVLAALVLGACGGGDARTQTATPMRGPTTTATRAAGGPSWPTYGGSTSRSGVAQNAPSTPYLSQRFAQSVDGQI